MAKKFMYVCLGILALMVVFRLGARYGHASYVDHSTSGVIAVFDQRALLDNGELWGYSRPEGWYLVTAAGEPLTLPVPVSQIKFIGNLQFLVDTNNNGWAREEGQWINLGPPGSGVATQPTTWGQIKAEFGE